MAACARLQRRDAEIIKNELNCNMVRCSHYPQSPHFLDACDELGLMVWEEPPGWAYTGDAAFEKIVLQNVHDMVVRDRNRPSVIVWATRLNETASVVSLYAQTRQLAYGLDGTRPTTGAMSSYSLRQVASVRMSADTTRDRLSLVADDTSIQADGSDATRLTFRALDAYGNQRPSVGGDVTLSLAGPAGLVGDNPFPFGIYGGVGGAFVRSVPGRTGLVTVTAEHPRLGQAAARLTVAPAPGRAFL